MKDFAAIFDWDGVIIDSSRQHERAWEKFAELERRKLPEGLFKRSFGMKNEKIFPELLGWASDTSEIARMSLLKENLYRQLIESEGIDPLPGVIGFLQRLRVANIPCAIGSSTPRQNIDCIIEKLGCKDFFSAIVCGEDVKHGKPHPEVFLQCARSLNAPPQRCVVFEDAHVGIEAARAGGMKVIGVATTHPADTLHDADRVTHRLDEIGVDDLRRLFANGELNG
jgi:beta-phosphoglucomutase family hydrolase